MTCNEYCSQHLPTIEVSASIKRDRTPTQVEIDVTPTAEAAARGSGCSLGRILEIDFPNPLAIEKPKNLRDFWSGRDLFQPNLSFNSVPTYARDTYVPDSSIFDVLNTNDGEVIPAQMNLAERFLAASHPSPPAPCTISQFAGVPQ